MKSVGKIVDLGLLILIAVLTGWGSIAFAIEVDDTADSVVAGDGSCTLREALNNANLPDGGDSTGGDCVAGK